MDGIISKLYYGEICPCEKPAPKTERYVEIIKTISATEEQILEQFPDCKELLDTYTDALRIEAQLESEADFERGFQLGALIAVEISKPFE